MLISNNFITQVDVLEAIFNKAQICLVFIAVFVYKDTKKYHFQKIYLLAELVHFFLTTPLSYVFTFSLEGSTEPLEPPLDPPQLTLLSVFNVGRMCLTSLGVTKNQTCYSH